MIFSKALDKYWYWISLWTNIDIDLVGKKILSNVGIGIVLFFGWILIDMLFSIYIDMANTDNDIE